MYSGIMDIKGAAKDVIQTLYSEYGYYMTLINIPLTLASTAPTSMIRRFLHTMQCMILKVRI